MPDSYFCYQTKFLSLLHDIHLWAQQSNCLLQQKMKNLHCLLQQKMTNPISFHNKEWQSYQFSQWIHRGAIVSINIFSIPLLFLIIIIMGGNAIAINLTHCLLNSIILIELLKEQPGSSRQPVNKSLKEKSSLIISWY